MVLSVEQLRSAPADGIADRVAAEPESQWFDRNSAQIKPHKLAESLVALANADGGLLVIGILDGRCEGVDRDPQRQNQWRQAGLDCTQPPVRYNAHLIDCVNLHGEADHLLALDVMPGEQVHATTKDEVYLRVGDSNRKLSFAQRLELQYDRGDTTFELSRPPEASGDRLDADLVAKYADRIGYQDQLRLLRARDLVDRSDRLNTAGLLLFGQHPQRPFPQAWVRVLRYEGTELRRGSEQNIKHDVFCEGTLPVQIDRARETILEHLPLRRALGSDGVFDWLPIIPEEVWMEALVNAVVHRAYSNFGDHIRVSIFDDRMEVASPGRFPGVSPPDDLTNVRRFARNPRIARVMSDLAYGQELGEGLRRMVSVMESRGLRRPMIRQTAGGTEVLLSGLFDALSAISTLSPNARRIYALLDHGGDMRTGVVAELAGVARPTALRYLAELESAKLILRVGSSPKDPTAYWTLRRHEPSTLTA